MMSQQSISSTPEAVVISGHDHKNISPEQPSTGALKEVQGSGVCSRIALPGHAAAWQDIPTEISIISVASAPGQNRNN